DPLLLALGRVVDLRARGDTTGVDPDEGELTEERVAGDLEGQRGERLLGAGLAGEVLRLMARDVAGDGGDIQRVGEEVDDRVEQRLDTAVLASGATDDRVDGRGDGELADAGLEL